MNMIMLLNIISKRLLIAALCLHAILNMVLLFIEKTTYFNAYMSGFSLGILVCIIIVELTRKKKVKILLKGMDIDTLNRYQDDETVMDGAIKEEGSNGSESENNNN